MKLFCMAERSKQLHDPHCESTNLCNFIGEKKPEKKFSPQIFSGFFKLVGFTVRIVQLVGIVINVVYKVRVGNILPLRLSPSAPSLPKMI